MLEVCAAATVQFFQTAKYDAMETCKKIKNNIKS